MEQIALSDVDWIGTIWMYLAVCLILSYFVFRLERIVSLCKQVRNNYMNGETFTITYGAPTTSKTATFDWSKTSKKKAKKKKK
jgi:hypothetical protein